MKGTLPWFSPEVAHLRRGARSRHLYGVRDVRCSSCAKHFQRKDVDAETGICAWCAWERLPVLEQAADDRFCSASRRILDE